MKTILSFEDDPAHLLLLQIFAERCNYHFIGTTDALEGLTLARRQHPDVIFVDLLIQDYTGWSIIETLRRDPLTKQTPIIVISSLNTEGSRRRAFHAGGSRYLHKPVTFKMIDKCLRDLSGSKIF